MSSPSDFDGVWAGLLVYHKDGTPMERCTVCFGDGWEWNAESKIDESCSGCVQHDICPMCRGDLTEYVCKMTERVKLVCEGQDEECQFSWEEKI